jgi:hypothetical protein
MYLAPCDGLILRNHQRSWRPYCRSLLSSPRTIAAHSDSSIISVESVDEASSILSNWDSINNPDRASPSVATSSRDSETGDDGMKARLRGAVQLLSRRATEERLQDTTKGRCMLGICAVSAEEGIQTLKSWVTTLQLPRGLLHGMDQDGVPMQLDGAVYIKYNTGGCLTFADIRHSGMGFDALWKPGDALLEPYDGSFRGCYFQVELSDGVFRQYLLPLDLFLDSAT